MFQPRINENGKPCCVKTLADGRRKLPPYPCPKCATHFGRPAPRALHTNVQENITVTDYTPPNPYAADLAKIREASATPESRFTEQHAARRTAELANSRTASSTITPRALRTSAESIDYTPPCAYRDALDKMKGDR